MWLTAGWCLFLAGLPWAAFLFRPGLDIWHSQVAWANLWTVIGLAVLVTHHPESRFVRPNWPLAALLLWVGMRLWWMWQSALWEGSKVYPLHLLPTFLHILCGVVVYGVAMMTWTRQRVETLLLAIAYSGIVVMVYSVCQFCGWDEFYRELGTKGHNRSLVGTIGNPSLYSLYLSFLLPILLTLKLRLRCLSLVLWGLLMGILAVEYKSLTGLLASSAVLLWWAFQRQKPLVWVASLLGVFSVAAFLLWLTQSATTFSLSGRPEAWTGFLQLDAPHPILGLGGGAVMGLSKEFTGPMFSWRHVHNEFFQMAIEYGRIGFVILVWLVVSWGRQLVRLPNDSLRTCLGGIGLASLVSAMTNFNWHLWLLGSFALVAYCGAYALEG